MNSENDKTSSLHKPMLNLSDKTELKTSAKHVLLLTLSL